jgi:hypothetical protein
LIIINKSLRLPTQKTIIVGSGNTLSNMCLLDKYLKK